MTRNMHTFLLFGLLLVAAPFTKNTACADDADEYEHTAPTPLEDEHEPDVVVLTDDSFDTILKRSKFVLVEFFAPWCGHCQALAPTYSAAATELKGYDVPVVLAKIDGSSSKVISARYQVTGFPSLKWFVNGELHSDYAGGREVDDIVSWVKTKTGPSTILVDTVAELTAKEESSDLLVIGFFKSLKDADHDAYEMAASKLEATTFIKTTNKEVAHAAGIKVAPSFAIIRNFKGEERTLIVATGTLTANNIVEVVNNERLPISFQFTADTADKIFKAGPKMVIVWAKAADLEVDAPLYKTFRAVAKAFKGKLTFVTANNEEAETNRVTNFFDLKEAPSPTVLGFNMLKKQKYRCNATELNDEQTLSDFAASVLEETALAFYKSAPVVEDEKDEGVTVVVGKSVEKIVLDTTKDVLLEVYAPWCGHCKTLAPIYIELAKRFEGISSVVIAKMDGTVNENHAVDVSGYPTLTFFPADKVKQPVPFSGDRSLEGITEFLKKHAKVPFKLPGSEDDAETESAEAEAESAEAGGEAVWEEAEVVADDETKEEL